MVKMLKMFRKYFKNIKNVNMLRKFDFLFEVIEKYWTIKKRRIFHFLNYLKNILKLDTTVLPNILLLFFLISVRFYFLH